MIALVPPTPLVKRDGDTCHFISFWTTGVVLFFLFLFFNHYFPSHFDLPVVILIPVGVG
jgi:hypothetical protein